MLVPKTDLRTLKPAALLPWPCNLVSDLPVTSVAAVSVLLGALSVCSPLCLYPLPSSSERGGAITLDKQRRRLGLAGIRPLKAIRLKIKQRFNEN